MSIFDDFDIMYGHGVYSGIPDGSGGTDIFHDGIFVDHLNTDGVFDSHGFDLSVPNAEGGHDVLDFDTGSIISHSEPNEAGGMNIFDGDMHLHRITLPNAEGGEDMYDSNMHLEARTMPNEAGSEDLYAFDNHHMGVDDHDIAHADFGIEHSEFTSADHSNLFGEHDDSSISFDDTPNTGNADEILSHDDPLKYSSEFHPHRLLFSTTMR